MTAKFGYDPILLREDMEHKEISCPFKFCRLFENIITSMTAKFGYDPILLREDMEHKEIFFKVPFVATTNR